MCEFCVKHGEGEKWYLRTKNYSEDLLSDVKRRRFIEHFSDPKTVAREIKKGTRGMERLQKMPRFISYMLKRMIVRNMKKVHFGQVVPIEEIEQIFGFTNSIVRVACICRQATTGKEKRYCYGISLAPDHGAFGQIFGKFYATPEGGPDTTGFETLTREQAIAAFRDHEHEGLCHTVWTLHTPFIGGICNCDRSDCLAMRASITHGVSSMFRAEYVALVDSEACAGCRECMRFCQFGALTYSAASKKAVIVQRWCYGCGVCRAACRKNAITLMDRRNSPAAANLWQ